MSGAIVIVGTLDTKAIELRFLKQAITDLGASVLLVDAGIFGSSELSPDIDRHAVAAAAGTNVDALGQAADRGNAVTVMAQGASEIVKDLFARGELAGIISIGGSGNATIGSAAMRALPVGVPKVLVTTVAAGDTRPYVGTADITMMYSVVDISGLNQLSRRILTNAAGAVVGMVNSTMAAAPGSDRPLIAATMFGVTTTCVTAAREELEALGYEVLVFHATGVGGRSLESLVQDGFITGVLDVTTTELADEIAGGTLSAGPDRLEAAGRAGIPQVVSLGALDMANFGPPESIPERFRDRRFYHHNAAVTLMRTTAQENAQLGQVIAEKLNRARGPVALLVPLLGVSMIDAPDQPFFDPEADAALFEALRANLAEHVELIEVDAHINDPAFSTALAQTFHRLYHAGIGDTA